MKLHYILLFVSTFAFGQINTEKLVGYTWYKTSSSDDHIIFSSVKRHKKGNFQFKLNRDQSFSLPLPRRTRCGNEKRKIEKGIWSIETIGDDTILILDGEQYYIRYKILYANSGMLKLQRYK